VNKKIIFIAIAFGTSVRDVLRNDTFYLLKKNKKNHIVIFTQDVSSKFKEEFGDDNVNFVKLDKYKATVSERIILTFHRSILRFKCRTMDLGNTGGNTFSIDLIKPVSFVLLKTIGLQNLNIFIGYLYKKFTTPIKYSEEFKKYNPDLVVVTRVLNFSPDYPVMREALRRNIPVVALVSSWDNLTSKAFFPFSLYKLVVWNNVLKKEAMELFQFPQDDIYVSGIPRYDELLSNKFLKNSRKDSLLKYLGITSDCRIITYATGSTTTGRGKYDKFSAEPKIATIIAKAINNGAIKNSVLVVRLHPQANIREYYKLRDFKNVIVQTPGEESMFQDRLLSIDDDIDFGLLMKHSDVVVNLASTVTIDAALFDTPIICINFDFYGFRPIKHSVRKMYLFDHYAKLSKNKGYVLAKDKGNLIFQINHALCHPEELKLERRAIVKQQCVYRDGKSGERVSNFLSSLI
jgi:hypothetical protein